jgi:type III secretion protein V
MISSVVALRVAAVILAVMMFIPGFPWPVFLVLAAAFMAVSYSDKLGVMLFGEEEDAEDADQEDDLLESVGLEKSPFVVRISPDLLDEDEYRVFAEEAREATLGINAEIGMSILPPRLVTDPSVSVDMVRVDLDDVTVASFAIERDRMGVDADSEDLTLLDVGHEPAGSPPMGFKNLHWIDPEDADTVAERGMHALSPLDVLLIGSRATQQRFASQCIGVQETRAALVGMAQHYPDLASEVRDLLPMNKVTEVFRRLIDENVPVRNQRLLLEALAEWAAKEQDPVVLTEYVRTALKRQICNALAGEDRVIPVYLLDGQVEDALRNAVRQTTVGEYLALDDGLSAALVEAIRDNLREPTEGGTRPIVLSSLDVRRFVRSLMSNNGMRDTSVLSYQDLSTEFTITPLTTILLPNTGLPAAAE